MHLAALLVGLIACVAIIVLGIRFILQPRQATLDFGIAVRTTSPLAANLSLPRVPRCESDWRAAHTFPACVAGRPLTARPGQPTRAEHCTKSRSGAIAFAGIRGRIKVGSAFAHPLGTRVR